jgi:hypothetical protein
MSIERYPLRQNKLNLVVSVIPYPYKPNRDGHKVLYGRSLERSIELSSYNTSEHEAATTIKSFTAGSIALLI